MTKILVGAVVTFIVLSIMTYDTGISILGFWFYGVGGVLFLYFFSIVCTAGAALIVWIPLWYVVGYGVLLTLRFILPLFGMDISGIFDRNKAKSASDISQPAQATLSRDQQALLNYIKKARAKGLSDEQISQNLTSNGWKADSITTAFQMA